MSNLPDPPGPAAPLMIVFNLGSGHGDAQAARAQIDAACHHAGREVAWFVADDPRQVESLAHDAVRQAQARGGVVVAAGGDGTLGTVAQATLGSGRAFGVLPQGTFNYFGRTHGIPPALDASLDLLLRGRPRPVQVGLVGDRVFLVNASVGLYPKLLEDRETYKQQFGRSRLVAFGAALKTLFSPHRRLHLRIEVDGAMRELRTPTLFVGNNSLQLQQFGIPEAGVIEHGRLAAIWIRPLGRAAMAWLILRGAAGRLGEAQQICSFPFAQMTVDRRGRKTGRPLKIATDGEVLWMQTPLVLRVAPEPLWLIAPEDVSATREMPLPEPA